MSDLERRTAQLLSASDFTSDALSRLLGEIDRAIEQADKDVEIERSKAFDPLACPDADKAREALQATEFSRDRLKSLRPRVAAKVDEVTAQEQYESWAKKFDVIPALHAAAAKRLREVCTRFEFELVDALRDAAVVDRHLAKVMELKPLRTGTNDRRSLPKVEASARGTDQIPPEALLMSTRFFKFDQPTVRIWPPSEPLPKSPAEIVLDEELRREITELVRAGQRMREAKAAEEAARAEAKAAEEREQQARREAWLREYARERGEMAGSTL